MRDKTMHNTHMLIISQAKMKVVHSSLSLGYFFKSTLKGFLYVQVNNLSTYKEQTTTTHKLCLFLDLFFLFGLVFKLIRCEHLAVSRNGQITSPPKIKYKPSGPHLLEVCLSAEFTKDGLCYLFLITLQWVQYHPAWDKKCALKLHINQSAHRTQTMSRGFFSFRTVVLLGNFTIFLPQCFYHLLNFLYSQKWFEHVKCCF